MRVKPQADELCHALTLWAQQCVARLEESPDPAIPDDLHDRAVDGWWSLLQIAALADAQHPDSDDDWSERARAAARALSGEQDIEDGALSLRLLYDLRTVFGTDHALTTAEVLAALNRLDDAPWSSYNSDAGMRSRDLTRQLRNYGIKTRTVRGRGERANGYHRDQLEDAWSRYCSDATKPPASGSGKNHDTHDKHDNPHGSAPGMSWMSCPSCFFDNPDNRKADLLASLSDPLTQDDLTRLGSMSSADVNAVAQGLSPRQHRDLFAYLASPAGAGHRPDGGRR